MPILKQLSLVTIILLSGLSLSQGGCTSSLTIERADDDGKRLLIVARCIDAFVETLGDNEKIEIEIYRSGNSSEPIRPPRWFLQQINFPGKITVVANKSGDLGLGKSILTVYLDRIELVEGDSIVSFTERINFSEKLIQEFKVTLHKGVVKKAILDKSFRL